MVVVLQITIFALPFLSKVAQMTELGTISAKPQYQQILLSVTKLLNFQLAALPETSGDPILFPTQQ
jgi:hypothetical protein